MDKALTTISSIESFFYDLLKASNVSQNIFVGDLPHNVKDAWSDVVVVDLAGYMRNLDARSETSVLVMLYAKPFKDGSKNIPVLDAMETKLLAAIDGNINDHYRVRMGSQYSAYDESRDLHCNIYSIELLIA